MYTSFYHLNRKPFQISSDPSFMWFGEKHKEALATLRYGISNNKGFLLLTGDVGTGKTTLINALLKKLSTNVICTFVSDPNLEPLDFINYIAYSFGIEKEYQSKGRFLIDFRKYLSSAYHDGKKVLLIIDEAQILTDELLEQIRLLSNIDMAETKLLNIFFVGQNEFNQTLLRENNRAVRQRITLNYNIDPFTPDETGAYIRHRLKMAGTEKRIFTEKAVRRVHIHSGGFPRRINVICDYSLLSGYVNDRNVIDETVVDECARELEIPAQAKERDLDSFEPPSTPPPPVLAQKKGRKKTGVKITAAVLLLCAALVTGLGIYRPDLFDKGMHKAERYVFSAHQSVLDLWEKAGLSEKFEKSGKAADPSNDGNTPVRIIKRLPDPEPESESAGDSAPPGAAETSPSGTEKTIADKTIPDKTGTNLAGKDDAAAPETLKAHYVPLDAMQNQNPLSKTENGELPLHTERKERTETEENREIAAKPDKLIKALEKKNLVLRFKYNSNEFSSKGQQDIEEFADSILEYPEIEVIITGYTDSAGYPEYNVRLSKFRANFVKSYLMGKGIDSGRIHTRGLGSENPVESNETAWGRKMNRRVEIDVYRQDR